MAERELTERLCNLVAATPRLIGFLRAVESLALPDWAIGAGVVRAAVWDSLAGFPPSQVDDIDVLYHDPTDLTWAPEEATEIRLRTLMPEVPWSVRNQARMHLRKGDPPYGSTENAMRHWLETPTCVALRIEPGGGLTVIAPFGLEDLFARRIRPTWRGLQFPKEYQSRLHQKRWHERWPDVVTEV